MNENTILRKTDSNVKRFLKHFLYVKRPLSFNKLLSQVLFLNISANLPNLLKRANKQHFWRKGVKLFVDVLVLLCCFVTKLSLLWLSLVFSCRIHYKLACLLRKQINYCNVILDVFWLHHFLPQFWAPPDLVACLLVNIRKCWKTTSISTFWSVKHLAWSCSARNNQTIFTFSWIKQVEIVYVLSFILLLLWKWDKLKFVWICLRKHIQSLKVCLHYLFYVSETHLWSIWVQLNDALQIPVRKKIGMPTYLSTYHDCEVATLKLLQRRKLESKHPLVLGCNLHGYVSAHRYPTNT